MSYEKRPWTLNAERTWHYHKRAQHVKEWREVFCLLALQQKIPKLKVISLIVEPIIRDARSLPDLASCFPSYKAGLDGIVDAGVIPDDGPKYVKAVLFRAPKIEKGRDALIITVLDYEL
jgi:crossover junction endodeoxyribonuclease RusA